MGSGFLSQAGAGSPATRVGQSRSATPRRSWQRGDGPEALNGFHRVVLDTLAMARVSEGVFRYARLEGSGLRDDALIIDALAGLSSVCGQPVPAVCTFTAKGQPLLEACRLVGRSMNLEVKSPPGRADGESLRMIARASNFRTRRLRLEDSWWKRDSGPLLGFLAESSRPVALIPGGDGGYSLIDASGGTRLAVTAEVRAVASAGCHLLLPPFCRRTSWGPRSVPFLPPLDSSRAEKPVILGVLSSLLGMVAPIVTGTVIDQVIPRADRYQLYVICVFLVSVGISVAAFQAIQGLVLVRIKGKLESELLPAIWDRLLNLPTRFFGHQESGDLALRIGNGTVDRGPGQHLRQPRSWWESFPFPAFSCCS